MDPLDTICLLRRISEESLAAKKRAGDEETQKRVVEYLSQITVVETVIRGSSDGSVISDSDDSLIRRVIEDSRTIFSSSELLCLDPSQWDEDKLPTALYLSNMIGAVNLNGVAAVPQSKKGNSKTVLYDPTSFQVRGKNYLKDGKKIKSSYPLFHLRGIQVVQKAELSFHVAQESWCGLPRHSNQTNEWLLVNYMIPGKTCVQVVCLFTASPAVQELLGGSSANETEKRKGPPPPQWAKLVQSFWRADQSFCDERFKLIHNIVNGSWAMKMAIGSKPALTGKKIRQRYFRSEASSCRYLEIDIDLSSSVVATNILSLVRGLSKSSVVDLGITIQGEKDEELPEVIVCQSRFDCVDLESGYPVNAAPSVKNK